MLQMSKLKANRVSIYSAIDFYPCFWLLIILISTLQIDKKPLLKQKKPDNSLYQTNASYICEVNRANTV
jgi:hypothetical protein